MIGTPNAKSSFVSHSSPGKTMVFSERIFKTKKNITQVFPAAVHEMAYYYDEENRRFSQEIIRKTYRHVGIRINTGAADDLRVRTVGVYRRREKDKLHEVFAYAMELFAVNKENDLVTAVAEVIKKTR